MRIHLVCCASGVEPASWQGPGGARPLSEQGHSEAAGLVEFLAGHFERRDEQGRRRVVRNGHLPARTILTGAGALEVAQPRVRDEQLQALDELVAVGVIQAAVALNAMLDQHRAARVGEDGSSDGERLEREQGQALVW